METRSDSSDFILAMTRGRVLLSGLLVFHLVAVTISAVPDPSDLPSVSVPGSARKNVVATTVGPVADLVAASVAQGHRGIWLSIRPLIRAAKQYVKLVGLHQSWGMFGSPPRTDNYARIRYYIGPGHSGDTSWTATELVLPAGHDNDTRLLRAFADSFWDKSFEISRLHFEKQRDRKLIRPDTNWRKLPNDLAPILRYHVRRFEQEQLLQGERVVRAELWFGVAPNPDPDSTAKAGTPAARLAILQQYYAGPVEERLRNPPLPSYHSLEREGDISWLLEYYESYVEDP